MKKFISLNSILLLLVVFLTACGSEPTTGNTGNTGTSTQPVSLRFAIWDKNQEPALQQMVNLFKKSHSNIDVKIEVTPWDQYWTKLETAATGGGLADVFWMNGPNFVKYASNGVLLPVSDQIATDKVDLSNYPQSLVDLYSLDGKTYTLPKDFDTIGLWYNKELFDAAGVKYPDETWTWDTLKDAAKKLTDPGKGVYGIASAFETQVNYYNTIFQNGGYVLSPDKKASGYDKPETIEGLKIWTDFIKDKSSPNLQQMTDTVPRSMFESGKIAMLYDGSWSAVEFGKNEYTKDKVDVAVMPQGKKRATVIHGLGTVINAQTQHPKEAWEFIKFLGTKEAAQINAESGIGMPAYKGTQDAWVKSLPQFNLKIFVDELEYSVPYPVSKNNPAWQEHETKILKQVWALEITPDEGGKQLAQKMNELLAQE